MPDKDKKKKFMEPELSKFEHPLDVITMTFNGSHYGGRNSRQWKKMTCAKHPKLWFCD